MQQKTSFDDAIAITENHYAFPMEKIRVALGQRISELRERAKLSQQALADEVDLGKATIQRLETGKHWPEWDTLVRIASRLDADVDDLFVGLLGAAISPDPEQALEVLTEFVKKNLPKHDSLKNK